MARKARTAPWKGSLTKPRLRAMVEEAIVDCHEEEEQREGWFATLEDHLKVPFEIRVLGVDVRVVGIGMNDGGEIVARCSRGANAQAISLYLENVRVTMPRAPWARVRG